MSSVESGSRRGSTKAIVAILLLIAVAAVALVVAVDKGQRTPPVALAEAAPAQAGKATEGGLSTPAATVRPTPTSTAPDRPVIASQATFYDLTRDRVTGTANQHEPWPALSLIKLYIADHVLAHGSVEDGYLALEMVATSDDGIAETLYRKYPDSVRKVAKYYGLEDTVGGSSWGRSRTSTYDVVRFLGQLQERDPHHPIFTAMSLSTPEAADGYAQNFGTATLAGAYGTKWGWSNDRSLHASATVGQGWIAAAAVDGGAQKLTDFASAQFGELARDAVERAREKS